MARNELRQRYFEWMYGLVCDNRYFKKASSYRKLFRYLHDRPFEYIIDMDGNRLADGEDLRYRFGREQGYSDALIASFLDTQSCSVLEMMVALAIRCEEHIMADDEIGDRTGQWFWNMIVSLGLGTMNDARFDDSFVEEIVTRFLDREYEPDGRGGLFTIRHCPEDMRGIEIWYQMCMYLDREVV